ncbi:hypothetical protein [Prochlorococcus marinus]|nr:hypothetical protein [Prochlorococcus marinus]
MLKGLPLALGLSIGWLGLQLIRNEKRLRLRYVDLRETLESYQSNSHDASKKIKQS